jgi:hypothetical protein
MAKIISLTVLAVLIASGPARAGDYPFLDELTRYAERIDTLSVTSGDAEDVNAATQIIDPWPPYARDRRIPANGQRMVGAINRYQNPAFIGARAPTVAPIISSQYNNSGEDPGNKGLDLSGQGGAK